MNDNWFVTLQGDAKNVIYAKENAFVTATTLSLGKSDIKIPGQAGSRTFIKSNDKVVLAGRRSFINKDQVKGVAYMLNGDAKIHTVNELWHLSNSILVLAIGVGSALVGTGGWWAPPLCLLGGVYYGLSSFESFRARAFLSRVLNQA